MARAEISCTPEALLADSPCTNCLSDSEIKAVLALILCKLYAGPDADCTAETLAEEAKCFACLDEHKWWVALLNLFYQYGIDTGALVPSDLQQTAVCINCLPPNVIRGIILYKLCQLYTVNND